MRFKKYSRPTACFVEEDSCSNPGVERPIGDLISRRSMLRLAGASVAASLLPATSGLAAEPLVAAAKKKSAGSTLSFNEIAHGNDGEMHVAEGYDAQVLLKWGDPIHSKVLDFDPGNQTAGKQARQFGYNCDYTVFLPLPPVDDRSLRGLLCVNHEYANTNLMFPGFEHLDELPGLPKLLVDVQMASLGHSIVEICQRDGRWFPVVDSPYNRRLTAFTPMNLSGPAAGHRRL
ncbi:MAG: DUF839 domain-containing protein, partial [Planctomycetales bacterium]